MTKDKTVTMSRELLANFIEYSGPISSTDQQWHKDKQELRALLAAPAVERQEPVAFGWWRIPEGLPLQGMFLHYDPGHSEKDIQNAIDHGFTVERLYTSPPAPVAVVLPDRAAFEAWRDRRNAAIAEHGGSSSWYVSQAHYATWEACLDKVKELNQ